MIHEASQRGLISVVDGCRDDVDRPLGLRIDRVFRPRCARDHSPIPAHRLVAGGLLLRDGCRRDDLTGSPRTGWNALCALVSRRDSPGALDERQPRRLRIRGEIVFRADDRRRCTRHCRDDHLAALRRPKGLETARRHLRGLVGAIAGIVLVYLQLAAGGPLSDDTNTLLVAGWSFGSTVIAGAMVGARLCSTQDRPWYRPRFRLRTMMLLVAIIAPFLIIVLPVRRYEAKASTLSGFYFLIVDNETRQPIANATVRLIDPRDKAGEQQKAVVTQSDGHAEFYLFANVTVRAGLLYETETISYDPQVLHVNAPNYEPFAAPLSDDTSPRAGAFTDRSLGLEFQSSFWS